MPPRAYHQYRRRDRDTGTGGKRDTDTKREFQVLYGRLGLPAADIAVITGKSVSTIRHYLSNAIGSRPPGENVLAAVRAAWCEKAQVTLPEFVAHLRNDGIEIATASGGHGAS
jgi:DNA-binding CsgD family transcriptional regulator